LTKKYMNLSKQNVASIVVQMPLNDTSTSRICTVVQSNLLKWITPLNGYHLSGPVQTQYKAQNMGKWILLLDITVSVSLGL